MGLLTGLVRSNHDRQREELGAFVDGALTGPTRETIERHVDGCASCRREVAELRGAIIALGRLQVVPAPRSFALSIASAEPRRTLWDALAPTLRLSSASLAVLAIVATAVNFAAPIPETLPPTRSVSLLVAKVSPAPRAALSQRDLAVLPAAPSSSASPRAADSAPDPDHDHSPIAPSTEPLHVQSATQSAEIAPVSLSVGEAEGGGAAGGEATFSSDAADRQLESDSAGTLPPTFHGDPVQAESTRARLAYAPRRPPSSAVGAPAEPGWTLGSAWINLGLPDARIPWPLVILTGALAGFGALGLVAGRR